MNFNFTKTKIGADKQNVGFKHYYFLFNPNLTLF